MSIKVAVVGATTWGTTLGIVLARSKLQVSILTRTPEECSDLNTSREHLRFLPGIPFPKPLTVSSNAEEALASSQLTIIAVPSDRLRENVKNIKHCLTSETIILNVAKGIELPSC